VIGGHLILIDGLLNEPQPEHLSAELPVSGRIRGNRGQMMNSGQLHGTLVAGSPII
jgi:hypothetical protein